MSNRIVEEPAEIPGLRSGDKAWEHPAFGQISASRVQGNATLYGSDFVHHHYVVVRIAKSDLHRSASRDWHLPRNELIEVSMSEAQWATFVSSMNLGGGVPCTIGHVGGKPMPEIPLRRQEELFRNEISDDAEKVADELRAALKEVDDLSTSLSKAKREKIIDRIKSALAVVQNKMPFVAKSFEEHMEVTVEKARVEVGAYILSAVQNAGVAALAGTSENPKVIEFSSAKASEGKS